MLVTYNIVCSRGYSPEVAAAVRSFLTVAADHGQAGLDTIGYVALPESIKTRLVAAARAIQ